MRAPDQSLGPDKSQYNQLRLWSRLHTTLAQITQIIPKWIYTVLEIFLPFRVFEQLALALKNRVCSENFLRIEYTFYIQDFWAACACPENRVCPDIFQARGPPPPRLVRLWQWCSNFLSCGPHLSFRNPSGATRIYNLKNSLKNSLKWLKCQVFFPMKIASLATPEGLAVHMWPAGHGLSTTGLWLSSSMQLFAHAENSEWFSIISAIIFEVNIVGAQKQA